jgi:hypothetical protein
MGIRTAFNEILRRFGYAVLPVAENEGLYNFDGLITIHNHDFIQDPAFQRAYGRGVAAAADYQWYWRVHIGLWAASTAVRLEGDFVECGVNRGFLSSAIMQHLDWDSTGKIFYLLDTFAGLDEPQIAGPDRAESLRNRKHLDEGFYVTDIETVTQNFSEWQNVKLIQGAVPETLAGIDSEKLAYLHLDMNAAAPETAAFDHLWDRLVTGAVILLDDYAFYGYREQKTAMDAAASAKGTAVASLPTGQGLIIKT